MKDYYNILGVPRTASKEDIKKAWRILAHQFHPDKNDGNDRRFKEVNEAYRILSSDDTRAEYDRSGKTESTSHSSTSSTATSPWLKDLFSKGWTWIIVLIVIGALSSSSSGNSTSDTSTTIPSNSYPTMNNSYVPPTPSVPETVSPPTCGDDEVLNASKTACITHSASCTNNWRNSVWDGSKCTCTGNYMWNPTETACVTSATYCSEKFSNSIYLSDSNTCGCPSGYVWNTTSTACVDPIVARNQSCASSYPNSEYLSPNATTGGLTCDCKPGYYWNNQKTACYSQVSLDQSCQTSYGQGSYSTTQNGNRVCDCSYGYSFNAQRDACVSTASINEICVRDVGRNSYYLGTVTNGKYNCSKAY